MKKTLSLAWLISLMLIISFAFVNCGGGGASPSSVVKQLYTALEKGDKKKVEELMTPGAGQLFLSMMEKAQGTVEKNGKIAKTQETIDGDKATVKVTYENGEQADFDLVKIDGKWKVQINAK
jgi:hypothetical protein